MYRACPAWTPSEGNSVSPSTCTWSPDLSLQTCHFSPHPISTSSLISEEGLGTAASSWLLQFSFPGSPFVTFCSLSRLMRSSPKDPVSLESFKKPSVLSVFGMKTCKMSSSCQCPSSWKVYLGPTSTLPKSVSFLALPKTTQFLEEAGNPGKTRGKRRKKNHFVLLSLDSQSPK